MKKKKPTPQQQYQLDVELVKTKPTNRTEAKAHLAARLRINKFKSKGRRGFNAAAKSARESLDIANAIRFDEGVVESVDTARISDSNKRWRGRTAD
ncbi:TPA: hypothetical protein KXY69_004405 [Raoultella ornithinolytica]|nr:hypothetical protein [Raoultella ornithinolytica]